MPKPRSSRLETPTARRRLAVRKRAYSAAAAPTISLQYRRNAGAGTWSVRCTSGGQDWARKIALADDLEPADGEQILSYWQALSRARAYARRPTGASDSNRPLTVGEAVDAYERDLQNRGADIQNAHRARKHLTAQLATTPVSMVTAEQLRQWRDRLIDAGMTPSTFNRTRATLRASLELAARGDRRRISNQQDFADGLRGLRGAVTARRIVLADADVLRIVRSAYELGREVGQFVETLATTGARPSQVARIACSGLQVDRVLVPPSYKGRNKSKRELVPVPVTPALAAKLRQAKGERGPEEPLLLNPKGERWLLRKGEHTPMLREIVARAGLDRSVTAYALRHSSIVRMLLKNVPLSVVARLHDTSAKEIENHYGFFIADHADHLARAALLQADPPPPPADNVLTLTGVQR